MKLELLRYADRDCFMLYYDGQWVASATRPMMEAWVGPIIQDKRGWQGLNYITRTIEPVLEANGWSQLVEVNND